MNNKKQIDSDPMNEKKKSRVNVIWLEEPQTELKDSNIQVGDCYHINDFLNNNNKYKYKIGIDIFVEIVSKLFKSHFKMEWRESSKLNKKLFMENIFLFGNWSNTDIWSSSESMENEINELQQNTCFSYNYIKNKFKKYTRMYLCGDIDF